MEILVIHGSNRQGNTDKTIEIVKARLNSFEEITYSDVYLPKDLPCFCEGCFTCMSTGCSAGQNCPHKQYTHPILEKMLKSDGIIIASPCYALAETAQVKAFFDHFACSFIVHRPNEEMFDKIGFILSTAAGGGTGRVISTVGLNMLFWGMKRIVRYKTNMFALNWDDMPDSRRLKAEHLLHNKTDRFYTLLKNRHKARPYFIRRLLWFMFKQRIKKYPDTDPDNVYWKTKGWM